VCVCVESISRDKGERRRGLTVGSRRCDVLSRTFAAPTNKVMIPAVAPAWAPQPMGAFTT